jgi:hypothetical protein
MVDRLIALAAAGLVVAGKHSDPLQERGFAGAVLADNDGDGAIEIELEVVLQKGKAKWIGLGIGDEFRIDPKPLQIGRGQTGPALLSRTHDLGTSPPDCANAQHRLWHIFRNATRTFA